MNEWIRLNWKSDHTLSWQDDNRWHVAMFLKFVNVTKLQFLLLWQVFWHSLTEEIFINVFTTASPDGLQRKELNSHSLGGSAGILSDFSGISWHKTICDTWRIVITHIENMLQLNIITRFTSLPSKKFKPHKINNKIKEIRENCWTVISCIVTRRQGRTHYDILILNISCLIICCPHCHCFECHYTSPELNSYSWFCPTNAQLFLLVLTFDISLDKIIHF